MSARPTVLPRGFDKPLELRGIEPVGVQAVPVAVPLDLDTRLAQLGDVDLQRVRGARRWPLTPDRIHETFPRDGRTAREHERDEERPRLWAAVERLPSHLERAEYPELHEPLLVERSLRPF